MKVTLALEKSGLISAPHLPRDLCDQEALYLDSPLKDGLQSFAKNQGLVSRPPHMSISNKSFI